MPHISNKKLKDEDFKKIYDRLISLFDTAGANRRSDALLMEFLTETEKIMFAKRLAALALLSEGVSRPYISYILFLSPSTVDRIAIKHEVGLYPYTSNILGKNKKVIYETLENLISESLSKRAGKKRLAWIDEIERRHKRKLLRD